MKLIKDLGTRRTKNRMTRYGVYQCSVCFKTKEKQVKRSAEDSLMCRSCASRVANIKHGYTNKNNKHYPIYVQWRSMKRRCVLNNTKYCKEWEYPEEFIRWSVENGWSKGLHLDKDIICERENIHPKLYSPETCIYITGSENSKESAIRNNPKRKGRKYDRKKPEPLSAKDGKGFTTS